MAKAEASVLLQHLRQVVAVQRANQLSDRQLLQQFLAGGDESAFAALVQRHGATVLAVCRSVLRHRQDAEDVFQATFLVLARKAASIRKRESLGSWLHGVAYRLAVKARANAAKRRSREQQAGGPAEPGGMDDLTWRELRLVLHEELSRLPEKYRSPLLLCYWQGMTQDEAARQLGWKKGTLKERLEQARNLLRSRLSRRGLTLGAPLLAAMLTHGAAAAVPEALASSAVHAALRFTGGSAAAGATAPAARLASDYLNAAVAAKWKIIWAVLLALGLAAGGGRMLLPRAPASNPGEVWQEDEPAPAAEDEKPEGGRPATTDRAPDPLPVFALA
jgi:RNA polymerase sigma factor (sigma-70 family)